MAAGYWIKLYQDILRDPKMGRLSDSAWRRCIELFLMAGEQDNRDGFLPAVEDTAWELRVSVDQLNKDLAELEAAGILELVGGRWLVSNFQKRQEAESNTKRWRRWRDKQRKQDGNEVPTVGKHKPNDKQTKRLTDIDKELETDTPPTPPAAQPKTAVLTIPEKLNTPEFLAEWGKWQSYRGKKIKQDTYQGQLDKLAREPVEFATARLERSRLNSWQGLWFADEKPIVINGRTADGQVYQNGHGPKQPTAAAPKGLAAVEEYRRRQQLKQ